MKNLFFFLSIAFVSGWFAACECPEEFVLNEETIEDVSDVFWVDSVYFECARFYDDTLEFQFEERMVFIFSQPVNPASIVLGESLLGEPYPFDIEDDTPYFSADGKTMYIRTCRYGSCDDVSETLVTLRETIKSQSGKLLDANRDGTSGEDGEDFNVVMEHPNCTFNFPFYIKNIKFDCGMTEGEFPDFYQRIEVHFSDTVNIQTLAPNQTFFIEPQVPVEFVSLHPTMPIAYIYLCYSATPCGTALPNTIIFTMNDNSILSGFGQLLDGDFDTNDGGIFQQTLTITPGCL